MPFLFKYVWVIILAVIALYLSALAVGVWLIIIG